MASRVVLGVASKVKWVKARAREAIHDGRNAYSLCDHGGLKPPSQLIRLIMYDLGEGSYNTGERRRDAANHSACKPLEDRSTLKAEVAKLMDRMNQGIFLSTYTYRQVLQRCSEEKDLESVKQVHDSIKDSGKDQHLSVANMLLKCYLECGRLDTAQEIFNKVLKRDTLMWNMMIGGFAKHKQVEGAFEMYKRMRNEGGQPDAITYLNVLKACASPTSLEWGKEIHAHILREGFQADVRIGSALMRMYINCGSIEDARAIFGSMGRRDVVSWTVMIGGLAQHGLGHEAFSLFLQMQREGFTPQAITYLSILNPCSSTGSAKWVREVHAHAQEAGLDVDVRVGTALVQMYARIGNIAEARAVFERLDRRDVFCWNVMIGGLAQHGLGHEAFSLFLQMQREGFAPQEVTYLSILNPCSSTGAVDWVKEVHAHAMQAGLDVDVQVGTALVQMYAKSGSIEDARTVFGSLGRRDVFSWNVMIGGLAQHGLGHEAFFLFRQMQREGFTPDVVTYLNILNPCSSTGAVEWLKEVHANAVRAGLDVDVQVGNAIVHMYAKSGSIEDARAVFTNLGRRDVVSWTVMIGGLAEHGFGHEAFSLFLQMQKEGFTPDVVTYLSILNPCSSTGAMEWVKVVHAQAVEAGLDVDVQVGNALIHMYGKTGSIEDAKAVFDRLGGRDVVSWTVMIGALAEHGLGHEAFSLFLQMQKEGITPDAITYLSILNPCSSIGAVRWVKEVHTQAKEAGHDVEVQVGNALVQMYAKTGLIVEAKHVFENLRIRDVISGVVMIAGLAQHGDGREALQLFENLKSKGVKPNYALFVAVLSACSHAGLVEEGSLLFESMRRDHGIEPGLEHYNCMVDMLGRAGRLKDAKVFILDMPIKPNEVTWKAFLGACRTHKNIELAELAAKECLKLKPEDASPYVLLSNAYAAVGDWDQVSLIRKMMQNRGIRKDPGLCWIEVGGKVHHFLGGDRSHPETSEIYAFLSCLSKKLKAEGYIVDTRLVLRNIAEEDKESAICSHSERLAIAYGLMHVPPGEPIRVYKNLRICSDCHVATKLISKLTGREIVARDAQRFHHFKDCNCSCGDYW